MSTQKLLAEAEKLLERGKPAEAAEKLKSCLATEPNNQLAVNKLASAYLALDEAKKAIAVLAQFARRMAEAGKPLVSVAIYKQALDLDPQNISLIQEFAAQCEEAGKLSEAATQAQKLLGYFLPRKKYFDALNIFPLLVRISPKDENIKSLWIESMAKGLAEMKLIHLLVALLGPPGLASDEFETGGDPTGLSAAMFSAIEKLLPWFPRDPKLPYALAWGHYKRGDLTQAFGCLREAIRRDPDFVLASLLFARILGEQKKLNESLFVYKYVKEKVFLDKQVAAVVLNRQIEAFEQNNGWMAFSEGADDADEYSAERFKAGFLGGDEAAMEVAAREKAEAEDASAKADKKLSSDEIDIGLPPPPEDATMQIELGHGGNREVAVSPEAEDEGVSKEVEFTAMIQAPAVEEKKEAPPVVEQEEEPAPKPPIEIKFTPVPELPPKVEEPLETPVVAEPSEPSEPPPAEEQLSPLDILQKAKHSAAQIPAVPELEAEEKTEIISRDALAEVVAEEQSLLEGMRDDSIEKEDPDRDYTSPIKAVEAALGVEFEETKDLAAEAFVPALADANEGSIENVSTTALESGAESEPDLGDDLLQDSTRMIAPERKVENTTHLARNVRGLLEEERAPRQDQNFFLEQAEQYFAKRNYYMARKSFRHALALGGDENLIRARLGEIRKLELPNSLYASISSDKPAAEPIEEVISRLEQEFKLEPSEAGARRDESSLDVDALFSGQDPRTLIDLGVGYLEMSLFEEAKKIFSRLVRSNDEAVARSALFLLAKAKLNQTDFGGAVGDLKRLTKQAGMSRDEKLSVFYALGEVFEKMKRDRESRKYYKKAAKIDANYRNVKAKIGEEGV